MKIFIVTAFIFWVSSAYAAAANSQSSTKIAPAERADIIQLVHTTGALNIGMKLGTTLSNQLIASLKRTHPNISNKAIEDIQQAVFEITNRPSVKIKLVNTIVKLYAKYYTDEEIRGMLRFYNTRLGKKIIRTLPKITPEAFLEGEAIMRPMQGELIDKIRQNLERDHINPNTLQPEKKD